MVKIDYRLRGWPDETPQRTRTIESGGAGRRGEGSSQGGGEHQDGDTRR